MRLLASLSCATLAFVAASPAAAQGGITGSNVTGQTQHISQPRINLPTPRDRIDGEEEMRLVAECAERNVPGMANAYIATMPGSTAEDRVYTVLEDRLRRCIRPKSGGLSFGGESLRAALAGAIYRHDFPADPDFTHSGATMLPASWAEFVRSATSGRRDAQKESAARLILLQDFGDCVADANPAATSRLVRSTQRTAAEQAAFNELVPHLGACLPNGVTFSVAPGPLRAYVAEGLLRKARAATGQGAANSSNNEAHK